MTPRTLWRRIGPWSGVTVAGSWFGGRWSRPPGGQISETVDTAGLGLEEGTPGGVGVASGRWAKARAGEDATDRARADPVAEAEEFALDAAVPPGGVVLGQADHQRPRFLVHRRAAHPVRVGPPSADQATVPGQQRRRGHQPAGPDLTGQQPGQRGQDRTVWPGEPGPSDLATQHGYLVAQHEQFRRPRRIATGEQDEPAEHSHHDQVHQPQPHEGDHPPPGLATNPQVSDPKSSSGTLHPTKERIKRRLILGHCRVGAGDQFRFLIHDHAGQFTAFFDTMLADAGITTVKIPHGAPARTSTRNGLFPRWPAATATPEPTRHRPTRATVRPPTRSPRGSRPRGALYGPIPSRYAGRTQPQAAPRHRTGAPRAWPRTQARTRQHRPSPDAVVYPNPRRPRCDRSLHEPQWRFSVPRRLRRTSSANYNPLRPNVAESEEFWGHLALDDHAVWRGRAE